MNEKHCQKILDSSFLAQQDGQNPRVVAFYPMSGDTVLQLQHVGEMEDTALVILNARLLYDSDYVAQIRIAINSANPDVLKEAEKENLDLEGLLLLALREAIECGQLDPRTTCRMLISSWDSWAGEMLWLRCFHELEAQLITRICGDLAQAECAV